MRDAKRRKFLVPLPRKIGSTVEIVRIVEAEDLDRNRNLSCARTAIPDPWRGVVGLVRTMSFQPVSDRPLQRRIAPQPGGFPAIAFEMEREISGEHLPRRCEVRLTQVGDLAVCHLRNLCRGVLRRGARFRRVWLRLRRTRKKHRRARKARAHTPDFHPFVPFDLSSVSSTSYPSTAAATAALRLSARPLIGMVTRRSQAIS